MPTQAQLLDMCLILCMRVVAHKGLPICADSINAALAAAYDSVTKDKLDIIPLMHSWLELPIE